MICASRQWRSGFAWEDYRRVSADELIILVIGQLILVVLTLFVGWAAWRRLEREGRGTKRSGYSRLHIGGKTG